MGQVGYDFPKTKWDPWNVLSMGTQGGPYKSLVDM